MFKVPSRKYRASELRKTEAAETVLKILHGVEMHLPRLDVLSEQYRTSLMCSNLLIISEPSKSAPAENEPSKYSRARLVAGFMSYKLMLQTNDSYNVVAISERQASDELFCALAWSDLFRSLIYLKTDAIALIFQRLQLSCPVSVQHALFGGKLTQERFLHHVSISKHTLQQRLKRLNETNPDSFARDTSVQVPLEKSIPEMPILSDLLKGEEQWQS